MSALHILYLKWVFRRSLRYRWNYWRGMRALKRAEKRMKALNLDKEQI